MNETKSPPTFHEPTTLRSPEITASLNDHDAYIQDGILYRTFKTINPM